MGGRGPLGRTGRRDGLTWSAEVEPGRPDDEPRHDRTGEVHRIRRPDGSELQVECYGPADAPPSS